MPADPQHDPRRCVPVRLTDIPLDDRIKAAQHAMRQEPEPDEKLAILAAALQPSDRIFWVAP